MAGRAEKLQGLYYNRYMQIMGNQRICGVSSQRYSSGLLRAKMAFHPGVRLICVFALFFFGFVGAPFIVSWFGVVGHVGS